MSCKIINNINQSLFVFSLSGGEGCQYWPICSVPLTVIKFLIIFMFVEFLIKKFFQSCSARTRFTPMADAFVALSVAKDLLDQVLYVKSLSIASTSNTTFWWMLQMQRKWVIFEPVRTHHLGFEAQNFENPIFTFGLFFLKTVFNYCKLQRLLQVAKFLFRYSFTHTNIVFLFKHLSTEIVIFKNVCY